MKLFYDEEFVPDNVFMQIYGLTNKELSLLKLKSLKNRYFIIKGEVFDLEKEPKNEKN